MGQQRRAGFSGDRPVEGGSEVVDIGFHIDRSAVDLFGGHVFGRALDAGFDGSEGAALAEVDEHGIAVCIDDDVIGFQVGMREALAVHMVDGLCDLREDIEDFDGMYRPILLEGLAWGEFHQQSHFDDIEQFADFLEGVNFTKIGVVGFRADVHFVGDLLEVAVVFVALTDDAFEAEDASRPFLSDFPDRASRAGAENADHLKAGQAKCSSCRSLSHRLPVLPCLWQLWRGVFFERYAAVQDTEPLYTSNDTRDFPWRQENAGLEKKKAYFSAHVDSRC